MTQVDKNTLTQWRTMMGFTEQNAIDALGCTAAQWRAWESGSEKVPLYIGLATSALALGISLDNGPNGTSEGK
jgi:transcriptional regulator with XRE-family HTH domain